MGTHDANGNRLQLVKTGTIGSETITYTYNAADQIVQEAVVGGATTTYSFDANGNMIQKSDGVNTYTYGYDYENRLISFDAPGTANDASYVYAIDSWERLSKTVNATTTKYLRDGPNVIGEYDGNNTLIATYLEGLNIDEHISKTIGTNTYRYFTDHLGSIRQFVDSSQVVRNSYDYSSFGEILGTPTENVSNDYRFTGRRWDPESSSQYHRWRVYFVDIGRWTQPDRLGPGNGAGAYQYADNDPTNFVDRFGTQTYAPWGDLIDTYETYEWTKKMCRRFSDCFFNELREDWDLKRYILGELVDAIDDGQFPYQRTDLTDLCKRRNCSFASQLREWLYGLVNDMQPGDEWYIDTEQFLKSVQKCTASGLGGQGK